MQNAKQSKVLSWSGYRYIQKHCDKYIPDEIYENNHD